MNPNLPVSRKIRLASLALVLALTHAPASATLVQWTLIDVSFKDQFEYQLGRFTHTEERHVVAEGRFLFDTQRQRVLDYRIATTMDAIPVAGLPSQTTLFWSNNPNASATHLTGASESVIFVNGAGELRLQVGALGDAGGVAPLIGERLFLVFDEFDAQPSSGYLLGTVVPEPPAWLQWIVGLALGLGLARARRHRIAPVPAPAITG